MIKFTTLFHDLEKQNPTTGEYQQTRTRRAGPQIIFGIGMMMCAWCVWVLWIGQGHTIQPVKLFQICWVQDLVKPRSMSLWQEFSTAFQSVKTTTMCIHGVRVYCLKPCLKNVVISLNLKSSSKTIRDEVWHNNNNQFIAHFTITVSMTLH